MTLGNTPRNFRHRFYSKPQKEQQKIQLLIALFAVAIILSTVLISWKSGIYFFAIAAFPVVLSLVAPFFDTPSLAKSGDLTYHSALFLSEKPKNRTITIHGGTLFDYVFSINRNDSGKQRTEFIIQQYLEGLLDLIERYNAEENFKIRGTSYIINERTAERMSFKIVKTDFLQTLILTYNYFNLLAMYSIGRGRLSFPSLTQTKTFETTLAELADRRDLICNLNEKLKRKAADRMKKN